MLLSLPHNVFNLKNELKRHHRFAVFIVGLTTISANFFPVRFFHSL